MLSSFSVLKELTQFEVIVHSSLRESVGSEVNSRDPSKRESPAELGRPDGRISIRKGSRQSETEGDPRIDGRGGSWVVFACALVV